MTDEEYVELRKAKGATVTRNGAGWMVTCPAHDDGTPSLCVGQGHDGRVLLDCKAGCDTKDVVAADDLTMADLFADGGNGYHDPPPRKPAATPRPRVASRRLHDWRRAALQRPRRLRAICQTCGWDLNAVLRLGVGWAVPLNKNGHDGTNRLVIEVCDGSGQQVGVEFYKAVDVGDDEEKLLALGKRNLWPAPEHYADGSTVVLVEGVGCALAVASLGMRPVAVPGAKGWKAEYAQRFSHLSSVWALPDADTPGRDLTRGATADLAAAGVEARIIDLSDRNDGFDVADFLTAGMPRDELRGVIEQTAAATEPAPTPANELVETGVPGARGVGVGTVAPPPESPAATAISGVPTGGTPGTPTLHRRDVPRMLTTEPEPVDWLGEGVVARGTLTLLAGREKEGKSLLAMALAARAASGGGTLAGIAVSEARTLVVDAENGDRELHRRLRSLDLRPEHAASVEVYEARGHDLRRHLHELRAVLADYHPDLLILDSWRSLWGGDENDPGEVARCLDPLRNLIREHDAAAVLIHHMRKAGGYRGTTAIGASVENIIELARHDEDPDRRRRRLRNPSCRYEQEADDRWLRIEADQTSGLLLVSEADPFHPTAGAREGAEAKLLAVMNGRPTTWAGWARDAGLDSHHGTARRARKKLVEQGLVMQDERGRWIAAPTSRSAIFDEEDGE
jgi:KaiC/GvpD/RAD55 family RecA-like ATPase